MDEHVVDHPARGVAQPLADPDRAVGRGARRPAGAHRRHPPHAGRLGAALQVAARELDAAPAQRVVALAGGRAPAGLAALQPAHHLVHPARLLGLAHPAGDEDDDRVALTPGTDHPAAAFAAPDLHDRGPDHRPRLSPGGPADRGVDADRPELSTTRARLWTAGCTGTPRSGPYGHERETSRASRRTPARPAAQAPAAAAPLAPAAGTVGPAAGPRPAHRARRRRPPAAAGADARRAGRRRRSGSVSSPGPCSAGRTATRPRSCCGGWSTPECSSTRTSPTGRPGSARRPPSSWSAADGLAAGIALGARTRRRRQRVDRCGRRRRRAGGRSRAPVFSTATAAGPAIDAVVDVVRRVAPGTSAGPPPARAVPDLCVLADAVVPEPTRLAALHRDRVAHLPVRLRDGTGIVGPLVLPGRSACLGCVELHRCARDPGWPAVTAQLVGRPGRGSAAAAAATAALGVAQVLAALDVAGGRGAATPPVLGATLELDLASGELLRRPWPAHPDCTCGAPPPAQTCEPRDERGTIMR